MNLLERVLTLVRFNLNSVVEKSDDPEKTLRQLQLDMRNQLVQVKTQVATAIAERQKMQKRTKEREVEADTWLKKAEQAVQQGNDDAARVALARHQDMQRQARHYQQQQKEQEQVVTTMRTVLQQLEAKISEVDTTIELLVARKRTAMIQQRVYEALNKTSGPKEQAGSSKAQDAVLEAEARARALAALHRQNLDTQLDQLSAEQEIEQKLNELKHKQRHPKGPPLLNEGNARPAPLQRPQPQSTEPASKRKERPKQQEDTSPAPLSDEELLRLQRILEANQNP